MATDTTNYEKAQKKVLKPPVGDEVRKLRCKLRSINGQSLMQAHKN